VRSTFPLSAVVFTDSVPKLTIHVCCYIPPQPAVKRCLTRSPSAPLQPTPCHVLCLPLLSCLSLPPYVRGLGLIPFSGLVYDLLLRGGWGLSPACLRIARRVSQSQSWRALLGGHQTALCLTYPSEGVPRWFNRALWSLVVKEPETWLLGPVSPRMHASPQTLQIVFSRWVALNLGWQQSGTVSWVLCD